MLIPRIMVIHSGVWLQFAVICLVLFFWKWPLRTHGFYELYVIGFTKQVLFKTPQEFLCDYAGNVPLTVQFSIDQNYHEWCNFQICLIVKFHSVQIISIGCYNKNTSKLVIKRHRSLQCGIECTLIGYHHRTWSQAHGFSGNCFKRCSQSEWMLSLYLGSDDEAQGSTRDLESEGMLPIRLWNIKTAASNGDAFIYRTSSSRWTTR